MSIHHEPLYPSSRPGTPPLSPSTQDIPSKRVLPERKRRVPLKAQPYKDELAKEIQAQNERKIAQKRKTEAEARPDSKPSGPIDNRPSKRQKPESSTINESILAKSLDKLTTDSERAQWYQAAIHRQQGVDVDLDGFDLAELQEMFEDPEATRDEIAHSDDDEMLRVLPAENDNDMGGSPPGPPTGNSRTPRHCTTPLARFDSSDYTTILEGVLPNKKRGRDENGNRLPLPPSGATVKTPEKTKQKAAPAPAPFSSSGAQQRSKNDAPPRRFQDQPSLSKHQLQVPSVRSPNSPVTTVTNDPPITSSKASAPLSRPSAVTSGPTQSVSTPAKPAKPSPVTPASRSSAAPAKPSTATPAKSSTAMPTASAKAALPTPKRAVAVPPKVGRSSHLPTSGPKTPTTANSRSAKHTKSRHQGGGNQGGGKRDKAARNIEEVAEEENGEGDSQESVKPKDDMTMRQAAQLNNFGKLRGLVKAVSVRIKIRALKENPYVDFTKRYSPPDERGHMHPNGYVLDDWLTEEWERESMRHFPDSPVPTMEQKHVKWLYERLSGIRNEAKNVVSDRIDMYGLLYKNRQGSGALGSTIGALARLGESRERHIHAPACSRDPYGATELHMTLLRATESRIDPAAPLWD